MLFRIRILLSLTILAANSQLAYSQASQVVRPIPGETPAFWTNQQLPPQPGEVYYPTDSCHSPILLDEMGMATNTPVVIEAIEQDTDQGNPTSGLPPGTRAGLFQKLFFAGTWVPQLDSDSMGWSDLEAGIVLGVPFLRPNTPLLITPRFANHFLAGPTTPDLPGQVYDAEVEFRHLRRFGEGPWSMMAAVTLGHYSDFDSGDADAFRVTGMAFGVYEKNPGSKWVLGVVYLNRKNVSLIPAVGYIYEPSPRLRWEFIMPRPRVVLRWPTVGGPPGDERLLYAGGELGGGVWSVRRPLTLIQDMVTYNDYRLLAGYERKIIGGISRRFEAGYVFGRELQFSSATPDVSLDSSLFLRAGLSY